MHRLLVVLLFVPAAALASDPTAIADIAAVTSAAGELEGTWCLEQLDVNGEEMPHGRSGPTITIRGTICRTRVAGDQLPPVTLKADTTRRPKWVTIFNIPGIYRMIDGKLHICMSRTQDGQRPKWFAEDDRGGSYLMVLTRASSQ